MAVDRGYPASIIDSLYKKLIRPRGSVKSVSSVSSHVVVLPFYPKISFQIAKILKSFDFKVVFSPTNKIHFSNLKSPIDCMSDWDVYEISCQCGLSYIGQTKRALRCRVKEHENYVKNKELKRSCIAQHCWSSNHYFNFSSAKIIQKCHSPLDLDFYEALHILKNSSTLVNDVSSIPYFSDVWKNLL